MKTTLTALLLAAAALLTACGGGGDDCTQVDCTADHQPVPMCNDNPNACK